MDISLKELAGAAGLSPSLFHRHFAARSALYAEVAGAGLATLLVNLGDASGREELVSWWVRFAEARPRHYSLMFSPEFAEHRGVSMRKDALAKRVRELSELQLGKPPTRPQVYVLFALIHGAASLVASGLPRQPAHFTVEAFDVYLAASKRTP